MKTIDNKIYRYEFTIKKSRFVSFIAKVTNKQELQEFLNKYSDPEATHNCYAYRIGVQQQSGGYEDNGEPSGTAGVPIFSVIEKNDLTNVAVLVIRYFGGIKLGAGPLTRTYSKAASSVIKEATILYIIKKQKVTISFPIQDIKEVESIINQNKWELIDKQFNDQVTFCFLTSENSPIKFINKAIKIIDIQTIYA